MSALRTGPLGVAERFALVQPKGLVASRLMAGKEAMAWTLPEQIAVALGDRILIEEIAPGNRIGEEVLARQYHVSRGPIRDALKILENVGLVAIASRRGAVASALTIGDLREILQLRENLLVLAVNGFARTVSGDRIAQLRQRVSAVESVAADPQSVLVYTDAVDRIMLFLAHNCGNSRVGQILTTLSLQSFRYFRRRFASHPDADARRGATLRFYRDLALAFEEGRSVEPLILRLRQFFVENEIRVSDYLP